MFQIIGGCNEWMMIDEDDDACIDDNDDTTMKMIDDLYKTNGLLWLEKLK